MCGLAHETKNPLGLVRAQAQRVQAHFDEPEQVRALPGSIIEQSDRILARLNEFLELSHRPVLRRQQVDLAALVGERLRPAAGGGAGAGRATHLRTLGPR
ncbi:MAG: histidine kinase dimerization/phospho-acceptor domain-containing protein [Planctomycetota bacterium]